MESNLGSVNHSAGRAAEEVTVGQNGLMRQAVLREPRHIELVTRPVPTPGPGEVVLRVRAALTGLKLTPEDIEHLHKGYVGLLKLMERIPSRWAWAAEPPHVFRADE